MSIENSVILLNEGEKNMKVLLVGGTFDNDGGKASSLLNKFYTVMKSDSHTECVCVNGGYYNELQDYLEKTQQFDVVFWWANVSNDLPKVRDVKVVNPKVILVSSKRNDNSKYSFQELINKALESKSNLVIEFSKENELFHMMVFDPLGTSWYDGMDIEECAKATIKRLKYLCSITRASTTRIGESVNIPDQPEFFDLVKEYAEIFHDVIRPDNTVKRFLGNSSFRCQKGFPSFRIDEKRIFVSRRNVDKRYISKEAFVATYLNEKDDVCYCGDCKPSVDTPIQLRLYREFPNINYMIHSHCYVKDAPFTKTPIPCGGLEEVKEILNTISDRNASFVTINLIGHGCIVMSDNVEKLKAVEFEGRKMPERIPY